MDHQNKPRKIFLNSANRLEALTDGVYAIVMTLLVLDITVPVVSASAVRAELPGKLLELWPNLFSYMISFLVLGVMWMNHHDMFRYVKRTDTTLNWLNILFLLFTALIPFSTALMASYLGAQIPFLVYGATLIPMFIFKYAMWAYATKGNRLVEVKVDVNVARAQKWGLTGALTFLLVAIAISFLNVIAGYFILALMLIYGILIPQLFRIRWS